MTIHDALKVLVFRTKPCHAFSVALCVIFLSGGVWAQSLDTVSIDADYPGGNIVVERIEGDTVYLKPDLRDTEGWWFYWNFRVTGAAGSTLTFRFEERDPIGVRGPAVSVDGGVTWSWMGMETVTAGQFTHAFPDDENEVRFAFTIPYLQTDWERFLAGREPSPNLVVTSLCKSRKGRDVELVRLGRLDGAPRFRVLVTARHHACEAMANYALEGMMAAITADDDDGRWFRDNVEVMAMPFMDKDGVEDGDQGKNRRPRDHNRDYDAPGLYPETQALRRLAPDWSDGKLKVALDLHCPYIRGTHNEDIYMVGSQDAAVWEQQQVFGALLEKVNHTDSLPYQAANNLPFGESWNTADNYAAGRSFSRWAADVEGMRLAASLEIPYANAGGKAVTPDAARAFGRVLAAAVRRYLEGMADPASTIAPRE